VVKDFKKYFGEHKLHKTTNGAMPNLASFISIKLKRIKANRVDRRQQKMPDL